MADRLAKDRTEAGGSRYRAMEFMRHAGDRLRRESLVRKFSAKALTPKLSGYDLRHRQVALLPQNIRVRAMNGKSGKSIPTPTPFGNNPFANLSSEGLPPAPAEPPKPVEDGVVFTKRKSRGRVDIVREKAHRGGKIVTVIRGFVVIGHPEIESLAKAIQKSCGTGGTVKDGQIEIQGDRREEAARILTEAGFRPVFAGG